MSERETRNSSASLLLSLSHPRFSLRFALSIIAALFLAASFPPVRLPILLPFGIASLLLAIEGASIRHAFYLGLACGFVFYGATLHWLGNLFGAAAISLIAIAALFPAMFSALYVWLRRRLPRIPASLVAGIVWTGVEYYRSEPFPLNFGWMGLGYGVINSALPARVASIVGCYGVTFMIVAVAAMMTRRPIAAIALWLAILFIPLPESRIERPITVRLVQATTEDTDSLFSLSRPGPKSDVIVWPEYSLDSDPSQTRGLWDKLKAVARDNRAVFIFGAKDGQDPQVRSQFRNTAFVLDSAGNLIGKHVKNHTVHFVDDGQRGMESRAIPSELGKLGVAICFDLDFPDVARRLTADGAEVFLIPNDDPPEWGSLQREQHRLLFQMRAAECGRWLSRADVAGGTSVINPNGRERAGVSTTDPTSLITQVGRTPARTVYVAGGWLFGMLCFWATTVAISTLPVHSRLRSRHLS